MKHSIFILSVLLSLSVLAFSQDTENIGNIETEIVEVEIIEESDNSEETLPPTENPGADSFHACNPIDRPQACTKEYAPVCGYIHDCEGGACTSTFGNKCTACAEENVDGYVEGACEDARTVCDPNNRPEVCTLIYTATCAVAANCEGPHCFEDTSSSCVACAMDNVAYSLPGTCPSNNRNDRTYCDPNNRPEFCTLEYNPVCAHRTNCVGDTCYYTAGNRCGACGDENVDYHLPGECSDDELGEGGEGEGEFCEDDGEGEDWVCEDDGEESVDNRTYCDPDNRPEVCTADYTPVCAHRIDCEGDDCLFTAGNECSACGDANVDWHTPGECPNDETDDNGEVAAGNDDDDDNDDERTYCPEERPEVCTADYTPVCAHQAGCEGEDCWNTAGNACTACTDPNVDYHTPGEC